jgi:L-aspartate oxidase
VTADVVVLGSGVAGLTAARVAVAAGCSVVLLTKAELASSATRYAQGGIAAALAAPDSPELHFSDTVSAGGGLCDLEAVRVLVNEGPARLDELMAVGAAFDRAGPGGTGPLALAREGGHSLARVLHAGGDATGAEVQRALVEAVRDGGADVRTGWLALDLVVDGTGRCRGVLALPPEGPAVEVSARHVVLASGGAGQLFSVTTNPTLSTGDGVAMALRAGAAVADVEFMQFHPTALHHPAMPRPLLSEALRGEGALLRDEQGVAFMGAEHPLADLAPRDVVARAVTRRLVERGLDHLWLDATGIDGFAARFPSIWRACQDVGLDPSRDWLPVAPAAHYLCGGVLTDLDGASSRPGLWAAGEVACTGVHGGNRLASNSLLEGLVFGHRVAAAIAAGKDGPDFSGALGGLPDADATPVSAAATADAPEELRSSVQRVLTADAGVLRDAASLDRAEAELGRVEAELGQGEDLTPASVEVANLVAVGQALVAAAREREESRGAHHRLDFPAAGRRTERIVHFGRSRLRTPVDAPARNLHR